MKTSYRSTGVKPEALISNSKRREVFSENFVFEKRGVDLLFGSCLQKKKKKKERKRKKNINKTEKKNTKK